MIFRYIKHALVLLRKEKLNFGIAILGLAFSLSAAALLASYCLYYFGYDRSVSDPDEWYRLRLNTYNAVDGEKKESGFYLGTAGIMIREIPEIKEYLIMHQSFVDISLSCDDKPFPLNDKCATTANFPQHYKLKVIYGNPDSLLVDAKSIIISKSFSENYFGKINPVGKKIFVKSNPRFVITAVFEDLPKNLHLRSDIYNLENMQKTIMEERSEYLIRGHIRVRIPDPTAIPKVQKAFDEMLANNPLLADTDDLKTVSLDPISKIHFMTDLMDDESTMSRSNIYAVMAIGILILLAALLNFVNLIILSWQKRINEFIFRKAVGADKSDIMMQLFTEYCLYFGVSILIAWGLYHLAADVFAGLLGLNLQNVEMMNGLNLPSAILMVWLLGIVTGLFASASFSRVEMINEEQRFRKKELGNRVILFLQLIIGFLFIATALIVSHHYSFIRNHDLGFDAKNTLQYKYTTFVNNTHPMYYDSNTLRSRIRSIPGVLKESATLFNVVAERLDNATRFYEDKFILDTDTSSKLGRSYFVVCTPDFFSSREIQLLHGRIPDGGNKREVLVNNTFAKLYYPNSSPLGRYLRSPDAAEDTEGGFQIAGVVADSWFFPKHNAMIPLLYALEPSSLEYYQITYAQGRKSEVQKNLDALFADVSKIGFQGFRSVDVAQEQDLFYKDDTTYMHLTVLFALVIGLISMMGIYAISSLHIRSQMKDIAIRKICGADIYDLYIYYVKSYQILFITSGIIGLLCAHYISMLFLDRFKLQAMYPWYMYPFTIVILALIVFLPLYLNVWKAWKTDPNQYLQSE